MTKNKVRFASEHNYGGSADSIMECVSSSADLQNFNFKDQFSIWCYCKQTVKDIQHWTHIRATRSCMKAKLEARAVNGMWLS